MPSDNVTMLTLLTPALQLLSDEAPVDVQNVLEFLSNKFPRLVAFLAENFTFMLSTLEASLPQILTFVEPQFHQIWAILEEKLPLLLTILQEKLGAFKKRYSGTAWLNCTKAP